MPDRVSPGGTVLYDGRAVGEDILMTSAEDARDALYSAITKQAKAFEGEAASESKAASIRELAEALAWLDQPGQPH